MGSLELRDRNAQVKRKQVQRQVAHKREKNGSVYSAKLLKTQSKQINLDNRFGEIGI